jgi:hypothetical protein
MRQKGLVRAHAVNDRTLFLFEHSGTNPPKSTAEEFRTKRPDTPIQVRMPYRQTALFAGTSGIVSDMPVCGPRLRRGVECECEDNCRYVAVGIVPDRDML